LGGPFVVLASLCEMCKGHVRRIGAPGLGQCGVPARPLAGCKQLRPARWPAAPVGRGGLAVLSAHRHKRGDWGPRSRVRLRSRVAAGRPLPSKGARS
jgi:hypothetical protein